MTLLKFLLAPFTLLYGIVIYLRNFFYDRGWLSSEEFSQKTIVVGNLSVGGTGKSPQIEYLVRLLQTKLRVATLSRGYKRSTAGFILADEHSTAEQLGDEPLQFAQKFNNLLVAVDEERVRGLNKLFNLSPPPELVLLDDAFQHRKVKSGFSILLTTFESPFSSDWMLPSGRLREGRSGARRADIIVVTKCPAKLSEQDQQRLRKEISPRSNQLLVFSTISYKDVHALDGSFTLSVRELTRDYEIVLVTGIANPTPLLQFLDENEQVYQHVSFPDHHAFSPDDTARIRKIFDNIATDKKLILTTEKDAMRLQGDAIAELPLFYLEIATSFLDDQAQLFDERVLNYACYH